MDELMAEHTPIDPFVDDDGKATSKTFDVTKPVSPGQLQDEIEAAVGEEVMLAFAKPVPDAEASADNPLTLFLTPDSVDGRKVRGVIDKHSPDPHYGLTEEGQARHAVLEKVKQGETLEPGELTMALQMLFGVG